MCVILLDRADEEDRSLVNPHEVPFHAKAQLIRQYTSTWDTLALDLLDSISPIVDNLLDEKIEQIFKPYMDGHLPSTIK